LDAAWRTFFAELLDTAEPDTEAEQEQRMVRALAEIELQWVRPKNWSKL